MGQRLGQHFLHDQIVVEQIVEEIFILQQELGATVCLEIGPGRAILTSHLIDRFRHLFLFEIDTTLKSFLEPFEKRGKAVIVRGDILDSQIVFSDAIRGTVTVIPEGPVMTPHKAPKAISASESEVENLPKPASDRHNIVFLPSETLVVGNLPYYITSPILRKFFVDPLVELGLSAGLSGGVFLIQKEVAEKVVTNARKKSYLWWLLNCNYQIEHCFNVGAGSFTPPPKVTSAVIKLVRTPPQLTPEIFSKLLKFLDVVSPYKRKTLGKIVKMEKEKLQLLGVVVSDELLSKRLEEITRDEMKRILS